LRSLNIIPQSEDFVKGQSLIFAVSLLKEYVPEDTGQDRKGIHKNRECLSLSKKFFEQ
jgi:hypothetical protein